MSDTLVSSIFRRYGYDPEDPVRGRTVPYELLRAIQDAPLVPESFLTHNVSMVAARRYALDRNSRSSVTSVPWQLPQS